MARLGEGGVGRVLVAEGEREGDVAGVVVPDRRRTGLHRLLHQGHRRQHLVLDRDQLGRVLRLLQALGHHEGNAIADRAHLVGREQRSPGAIPFRAADVLRHRIHQRADPLGRRVLAGEDAEHARRGGRLRGVDAHDARMCMRRHHHDAVALPRQSDVVDITAEAGDEALVLDPADRLADAEFVNGCVHCGV